MKRKLILVILFSLVSMAGKVIAQNDNNTPAVSKDDPAAVALTQNLSETDTYVWPKDPKVMENLKKWQGYKFGLLIHMGLYSELGIIESWALCPEDWITRDGYDD
ncbi:MAG: alpha-L-fucosidase [Mariniphaga sp.]|nr:alpha-L-fucosidase [Mariniphaga sp.]